MVNGVSGTTYGVYNSFGRGQGHGNGMGRIMRSLTKEQREEVASILSSLPQDERSSLVSQIKSLDASNLSQEELFNQVISILSSASASTTSETSAVSVYA
ncbi:hypothetical protein [Thermovibrio sp.]